MFILVAAAWAVTASGATAESADVPNILFIVTDDQGPWAFGAAGEPNALTPHLDALRAQGAMLTNCYAPTPVCSPARASILTSRYGTEVGVLGPISENSKVALSPTLPTWPRLLSDAGYVTGLIGKYHLGHVPESHPGHLGYTEFAGFLGNGGNSINPRMEIDGETREIDGWTSDILTDHAVDFIRRRRAEPWALSLHYWAPHANQAGNSPEGGRTWLPLAPDDWDWIKDVDPTLPEPDYPHLDVARNKRMLREYLGSIHSVDRNVGRLLALLEELDLAARTVVIFTSDHGFNMGHHGIWHKGNGHWLVTDKQGQRRNMWDTSLKVPALVRWPGRIEPGSEVRALVSHLDWLPTLAAIVGQPLPDGAIVRGRNVLPALLGESADWPNEFYAQQNLTGAKMRSYQTERWKLIRFFHPELTDEFYDRVGDPHEHRNLIDSDDPDVREALRDLDSRLRQSMLAIGDPALATLP